MNNKRILICLVLSAILVIVGSIIPSSDDEHIDVIENERLEIFIA